MAYTGESLSDALTATYDAWNRLVELKAGTTLVAQYRYDGLGRRITRKTYTSSGSLDTTYHDYLSRNWQLLETRENTSTTAADHYVWGLRYIDDLVRKDSHYALTSVMYNVLAMIDGTSSIAERYRYTAYGKRTVLDPDFSEDDNNTSDLANPVGHQGMHHDGPSGGHSFASYRACSQSSAILAGACHGGAFGLLVERCLHIPNTGAARSIGSP